MSFGKNLQLMRKKRGFTQSTLSNETGIPQTTISGWETEKYEPGITEAALLARALKCSLDNLVDDLPRTGTC